MCKAPIIGRVKTRLICSGIDAATACTLHKQMATVVIKRAIRLFPGAVTIAADQTDHPFFTTFAQPVTAQGEGDLGERMERIANRVIDHSPLLFLGTDSPHMESSRLTTAVTLAKKYDAVAGPVEDGGYDLILLTSRKTVTLLQRIEWGSQQVWQQTHQRAEEAGINLAALPLGFDVDSAADLQRSQSLQWE
ncbi:MAG: TIGR04282 family arsenosugar biosynthesis glycosyltransferase [Mariprofundales bacterium]|nr:TIGR04282 family arsenosugar biosynthesis glycosyltransferase [Mariprofundales bacterium]